jgi:hypothetical protein
MRRLFSGRDAVVYRNLLVLVTVAPPIPLAKLSVKSRRHSAYVWQTPASQQIHPGRGVV